MIVSLWSHIYQRKTVRCLIQMHMSESLVGALRVFKCSRKKTLSDKWNYTKMLGIIRERVSYPFDRTDFCVIGIERYLFMCIRGEPTQAESPIKHTKLSPCKSSSQSILACAHNTHRVPPQILRNPTIIWKRRNNEGSPLTNIRSHEKSTKLQQLQKLLHATYDGDIIGFILYLRQFRVSVRSP